MSECAHSGNWREQRCPHTWPSKPDTIVWCNRCGLVMHQCRHFKAEGQYGEADKPTHHRATPKEQP